MFTFGIVTAALAAVMGAFLSPGLNYCFLYCSILITVIWSPVIWNLGVGLGTIIYGPMLAGVVLGFSMTSIYKAVESYLVKKKRPRAA